MDASSSKNHALFLLGIMDLLLEDPHAFKGNVPEAFLQMKSVDPSLLTKIASHSMQSRMQLLTLMAEILGMPCCMSQDGNAICVGNSVWPQGLKE